MYPPCMIVGCSDQEMVLPQEDLVPRGHEALQKGKTAVFGLLLWRIVLQLQQKFELQNDTTDLLPFMNSIQERVFQQDNAHPHTAAVMQHAPQSVDMLPWPARSLDPSPMEISSRMGYLWTTTPASSTASTDHPSFDTTSTTSMGLYTTKWHSAPV
ncbi:hypothetical protein TNCV_4435321 [Trichonephila clavipes]|nr:hypothetical protein TNCV_4435321 [Trichonephila clavipes]